MQIRVQADIQNLTTTPDSGQADEKAGRQMGQAGRQVGFVGFISHTPRMRGRVSICGKLWAEKPIKPTQAKFAGMAHNEGERKGEQRWPGVAGLDSRTGRQIVSRVTMRLRRTRIDCAKHAVIRCHPGAGARFAGTWPLAR